MRDNMTDYDEVSEYGDTDLERWAFRHKGAIQWTLAFLNGFFIGMVARGLIGW